MIDSPLLIPRPRHDSSAIGLALFRKLIICLTGADSEAPDDPVMISLLQELYLGRRSVDLPGYNAGRTTL